MSAAAGMGWAARDDVDAAVHDAADDVRGEQDEKQGKEDGEEDGEEGALRVGRLAGSDDSLLKVRHRLSLTLHCPILTFQCGRFSAPGGGGGGCWLVRITASCRPATGTRAATYGRAYIPTAARDCWIGRYETAFPRPPMLASLPFLDLPLPFYRLGFLGSSLPSHYSLQAASSRRRRRRSLVPSWGAAGFRLGLALLSPAGVCWPRQRQRLDARALKWAGLRAARQDTAFVFPLPSRLRHCRCLVFPLPSRLSKTLRLPRVVSTCVAKTPAFPSGPSGCRGPVDGDAAARCDAGTPRGPATRSPPSHTHTRAHAHTLHVSSAHVLSSLHPRPRDLCAAGRTELRTCCPTIMDWRAT